MGKHKSVIISNKLFHTVWDLSLTSDNFDSFYYNFSHTKEYQRLINSGVSLDLIYDFLHNIHQLSNTPIRELLITNNIKNSTLSHLLCIPVKTIEGWKSGRFDSPPYIKLMIAKHFQIPYLPAGMKLENDIVPIFNTNKPSVTKKTTELPQKSNDKSNIVIENKQREVYNIDELLLNDYSQLWSLKEFEQTHLIDNYDLLSSTDYLGDIIKSRKQKE